MTNNPSRHDDDGPPTDDPIVNSRASRGPTPAARPAYSDPPPIRQSTMVPPDYSVRSPWRKFWLIVGTAAAGFLLLVRCQVNQQKADGFFGPNPDSVNPNMNLPVETNPPFDMGPAPGGAPKTMTSSGKVGVPQPGIATQEHVRLIAETKPNYERSVTVTLAASSTPGLDRGLV